MFDGDRHRRLPVKRHSAREHLKQSDTQRIDIALLIAVAAPCLLRRRIVDGTHHIGSDGIAGGCLRNTEIRHFHLALFGDHDILRLDISVNNMVVMGSLDTHGNLNCYTDGLLDGKPCFLLDIFF